MKIFNTLLLMSMMSPLYADTIATSQIIQSQASNSTANSYLQKYDRNGDKMISDAEFFNTSLARRSPELAEKLFMNMDRNGDGVISEKEILKSSKSKSKKK